MGESFDAPGMPTVQFQVLGAPPMPRFWFMSDDQTRLVQVQHDLLAHNWRRMRPEDNYPRYDTLRDAYVHLLDELSDVLSAEGKLPLKPNWSEVTYVNHIPAVNDDGNRINLHDVVAMVAPLSDSAFLPEPEDQQFAARFRIEEADRPIGRLTLAAAPATTIADGKEIWNVTLTARAMAREPTRDAALARLDLCHGWVVRGFRDTTTRDMHERWGLREDDT